MRFAPCRSRLRRTRIIGNLLRKKDAQIAQVVSCWSGYDRIVQFVKERVGIAALEIIAGIQRLRMSARECFAVCDGASRRTTPINAVGANAEHGDPLSRDSVHAVEYECRVPPAYP